MRSVLLAFTFIFALAPVQTVPKAEHWYGIKPLSTTRREVERRLGASKSDCGCVYETLRERIYVQYTSGGCTKNPAKGWRVPDDTIISFQVYPKYQVRFSELKLDEKVYVKLDNDELPGAFIYVDEKAGVSLEADNDLVVSYNYAPSLKDDHLRCKPSR